MAILSFVHLEENDDQLEEMIEYLTSTWWNGNKHIHSDDIFQTRHVSL